jgi:hypothetical protein
MACHLTVGTVGERVAVGTLFDDEKRFVLTTEVGDTCLGASNGLVVGCAHDWASIRGDFG